MLYLQLMKVLKNILALLMGLIFLVSSSGYVLYSIHCVCTGEQQTSVFVKPKSCETSLHHAHNLHVAGADSFYLDDDRDEQHECMGHTRSCGCDSPQVFFFKLQDKATNEEIRFVAPQALSLDLWHIESLEAVFFALSTEEEEQLIYPDPVPPGFSSLDFLVRIQQLKIPSVA